jgi:hypothetical protein
LQANTNRGDGIEYGQRHRSVVGDRVLGVLNLMEMTGGDEAFINIKYMVRNWVCRAGCIMAMCGIFLHLPPSQIPTYHSAK